MSNTKTLNWMRGLFTLISKIDPTFELAKNNPVKLLSTEAISIESLSATFNQLPEQSLNDYLASLASKLETTEGQSETSRKIIDKIHQHLLHQDENKRQDLSKADIDKKAAELGINREMIDVDQCAEIYDGIDKMFAPNQCPRESLLEGAIKLSLFAGNKHEAVAYLKRHATNQIFSLETYLQAIKVTLPISMTWTPGIWKNLFKNNKPTSPHDLFFKLLPIASVIEQAYRELGLSITPKTPLKTLNVVAANQYYQNESDQTDAKSLFFQHGVPKSNYDSYKKYDIKDDGGLLPNITISGEEISEDHSPFYLTKLDKHEPLAAIIGDMTGCCEGIHKKGSSYVQFALTQNFAGYYVLYDKRKVKGEGVVAHCIAWRVGDYIVYSSVETNINYRNRLPLVADFYYMLAKKLMSEHGINRIFVWEWHKGTPPFLGTDQKAPLLYETLKNACESSGVPAFFHENEQTVCIADAKRPYLNYYSMIRKLPVIDPHFTVEDRIPFTCIESGEIFDRLLSRCVSGLDLQDLQPFFKDLDLQPLLEGVNISQAQFENNKQAFLKLLELSIKWSHQFRDDELDLESCCDIMKITKHRDMIPSSNEHEWLEILTLITEANRYYHLYALVNEIFQSEYLYKGLTREIVTRVTSDFYYNGCVNIPFDNVDIDDDESVRCYLRKYFDFCVLILEMKAVSKSLPFDIVRFNYLYDAIYPRHPVTCMEILRDAIKEDNHIIIDAMFQKRINLNEDYQFQETPLILAIKENKYAIVDKFLKHGADHDMASYGFIGIGETPLEVAARNGQDDIFYRLIINGANPNAISKLDKTNLLHHVHQLKKPFWVSYLINHGLDINHLSSHYLKQNVFNYGVTSLYCAASSGRDDLFKRMMQHGADIDKQNREGDTMLHVAVRQQQLDVVNMFIQAGASLTMSNLSGETAYDVSKSLHLNAHTSEAVDKIFEALSKAVKNKHNQHHQYSPKLFHGNERKRHNDQESHINHAVPTFG